MSQAGSNSSSGGEPTSITLDADSGSATGSTILISGDSTGLTTTASGTTMDLAGTLLVAHGGTGDTSFTPYSVITGGTTSTGALQNVSGVGTSGQVLTSNGASTLPTWQNSANYISITPYIVGPDVHSAYTTIGAAIAAAVSAGASSTSPANIYVKPQSGGYTENPILADGINLVAFGDQVLISGKITMTTNGSASISGFLLQTNSDYLLSVTGSAASVVTVEDCYLNFTNNNGIQYTSSSASSEIFIGNSKGNLTTTGIAVFTHSGAGQLIFHFSEMYNTGGSITPSTQSSGQLYLAWGQQLSPITTSGTADTGASWFGFQAGNATALTLGGSGTHDFVDCVISSGTATAIVVNNTTELVECSVASSNTNAISGSGTVNLSLVDFYGPSSGVSVSTQNPIATRLGSVAQNTSGQVTNVLQPCFFSHLSTTTNNVTGDGTEYTVVFDTATVNQSSSYSTSTGFFTAPVTGNYLFTYCVFFNALGASTDIIISLQGSRYNFRVIQFDNLSALTVQETGSNGSMIINMVAGDTISLNAAAFGTTKTVGVSGGPLTGYATTCTFSGMLLC